VDGKALFQLRRACAELPGQALPGAVQASLGRDSRAPEYRADGPGAETFPGSESEHLPVGLTQCPERRGKFHVSGDKLGVVKHGGACRVKPCPVIQPAATGEGSPLIGNRQVSGAVQPWQGLRRQVVNVPPRGKKRVGHNVLRQVGTDTAPRVRQYKGIVSREQLGKLPNPGLFLISSLIHQHVYVRTGPRGYTPPSGNFRADMPPHCWSEHDGPRPVLGAQINMFTDRSVPPSWPLVEQLLGTLRAEPLTRKVHSLRVFVAYRNGKLEENDVLLDSEPWPRGEAVVANRRRV
jgi:hypothetical protein